MFIRDLSSYHQFLALQSLADFHFMDSAQKLNLFSYEYSFIHLKNENYFDQFSVNKDFYLHF